MDASQIFSILGKNGCLTKNSPFPSIEKTAGQLGIFGGSKVPQLYPQAEMVGCFAQLCEAASELQSPPSQWMMVRKRTKLETEGMGNQKTNRLL